MTWRRRRRRRCDRRRRRRLRYRRRRRRRISDIVTLLVLQILPMLWLEPVLYSITNYQCASATNDDLTSQSPKPLREFWSTIFLLKMFLSERDSK